MYCTCSCGSAGWAVLRANGSLNAEQRRPARAQQQTQRNGGSPHPQQIQPRQRQLLQAGATCQATNSSGVSVLEEARRLTRDEKRDVAYREGARYLRQHLGIDTQTELTRVLDMAMNPNSLFADRQTNKMRAGNASARLLSVEGDMQPVVECLIGLGMSSAQIKEVIITHPPVISYSPTDRIQPFVHDLQSLGVQDPVAIILRRPSLLGLSTRDSLKRIVAYLLESGNTMEEVAELLATTV